jgi:hypothetical protein
MFSLLQPSHQVADVRTSAFVNLILDSTEDYDVQIDYIRNERNISSVVIDDITTTSNGTVVFSIPNKFDNISEILIGSNVYVLAVDSTSLKPGEFIYDPSTNKVTLFLLPGDRLNSSAVIVRTEDEIDSSKAKIISDCCDGYFSERLQKWNPNGSLIIQHTFQQEPSFAFTFTACSEQEKSILRELANGTIHEAFGWQWAVSNLQITRQKPRLQKLETDPLIYQIDVTVTCQHFYASLGTPSRSPMDKLLKLQKVSPSNPSTYLTNRNLADLVKEAGVNYLGRNIQLRTPKSTSSTETTTIRQILEERGVTVGGFIYYSPAGVELKQWALIFIPGVDQKERTIKEHIIKNSDVRSPEITYNYNGHGSIVNDVKLHTEYRNVKVSLDFDPDQSDDSDSVGIKELWAFENCESFGEMSSAAERFDWYLKQPSVDILRNPGINFDAGGVVKKATKTIYLNGSPVFQQEWRAGYAFSSDQVHRIRITDQGGIIIELETATFPQSYWQEIYQATSDWRYDDNGYLTSIDVSGRELARLQQESNKLEAVSLKAQAYANAIDIGGITVPDPSLMAQAAAYQFTENLPVEDTTLYQLKRHRDYYDDIVKPACGKDPDWVEPKFLSRMWRSQENYFIKENPKNNEFYTYPPILSGRFSRESQEVSILSKDKYEVRNRKQNSEGEYFKNARAEGNTDYSQGRPPTHTRLEKEIDPDVKKNPNYKKYKDTNYYLDSGAVFGGGTDAEEGSKGYPDLDTPSAVLAAATTELSIINSQNACTTSIDIEWRRGISVGDFAVFQGKRWVILGIEDNRRIEYKNLKSESFVLKLGLYLDPGLLLTDRSVDC